MNDNQWKVIYVSSRHEKKVALLLTKYNIVHYLPMVKRLQQWSDRKKWVESPLFNGYIFVKPTELQTDEVLQIPSVVKYVKYNGLPAVVRDSEIETIHNMIEFGYELNTGGWDNNMIPGSKVTVTQGALKGMHGELVKIKNETQFMVVLETINQFIRVSLPPDVLESIS